MSARGFQTNLFDRAHLFKSVYVANLSLVLSWHYIQQLNLVDLMSRLLISWSWLFKTGFTQSALSESPLKNLPQIDNTLLKIRCFVSVSFIKCEYFGVVRQLVSCII
jgi:hypothetical protein